MLQALDKIRIGSLESMIWLSDAIAQPNCTSEIISAFVRETYILLRQPITHVEHDAIEFNEDELEGERGNKQRRATDDLRWIMHRSWQTRLWTNWFQQAS
ncbi:hypothetical protein BDZ97DRAFT_2079833 [Flammula alnicola]|nr:hypothetical protein BDZ97DRAFT_2079833 [Flammula alnicola]